MSRTRFAQAGSTHPRCKHSFVLSSTANCKPKEPCPLWNARNLSLSISSKLFSTARISASLVLSNRQLHSAISFSMFSSQGLENARLIFSIFSLFLLFESLVPVLYGLLMFLFKGGWQWTVGIGDHAICL